MKVISLTQPWATLVVIGAKKFETRSWSTNYRGPLLIHASKRFTNQDKHLCCFEPFLSALSPVWKPKGADGLYVLPEDALPTGKIIGRVDLVDCTSTCLSLKYISSQEYAFGNYADGRWAWLLKNPVRFETPIPAKGSLGIWEFPESELAKVEQ